MGATTPSVRAPGPAPAPGRLPCGENGEECDQVKSSQNPTPAPKPHTSHVLRERRVGVADTALPASSIVPATALEELPASSSVPFHGALVYINRCGLKSQVTGACQRDRHTALAIAGGRMALLPRAHERQLEAMRGNERQCPMRDGRRVEVRDPISSLYPVVQFPEIPLRGPFQIWGGRTSLLDGAAHLVRRTQSHRSEVGTCRQVHKRGN
jgi:hypothetical protein